MAIETKQFRIPALTPREAFTVYDPIRGVFEPVDANVLRLYVLGIGSWGKIVDENVVVTVPAGSTTGKSSYGSEKGFIVIRKITIPANVKNVNIYADGVKVFTKSGGTSAITVDLFSEYGATVYGKTIDIEIELASAPSSDTNYTVTIKGTDIPTVQEPA